MEVNVMTWEEVQNSQQVEPDWLIDPFVVKGGITLLWGKYSTGKSPLTWAIAQSIGNGTSFFGLPVKPGSVLYVEIDLPENLAVPRLKYLKPAPNVHFAFMQSLSLGMNGLDADTTNAFKSLNAEIKPDLVIFDSLRKLHDLDDKDARAPKMVYSIFQHLFPGAALLFIHHERKSSLDPRFSYLGGEAFSGNQHWIDDAQVGLQMEKYSGKRESFRLWHRKGQGSEKIKPMGLSWNGKELSCPLFEDLLCAYEGMHEGLGGGELDHWVSEKRGIGLTASRERRLIIEAGKFPGSRKFLSPEPGEGEEEE